MLFSLVVKLSYSYETIQYTSSKVTVKFVHCCFSTQIHSARDREVPKLGKAMSIQANQRKLLICICLDFRTMTMKDGR